jgi:hypothetical protein
MIQPTQNAKHPNCAHQYNPAANDWQLSGRLSAGKYGAAFDSGESWGFIVAGGGITVRSKCIG